MNWLWLMFFISYMPSWAQNSSPQYTCEDLKSIIEFQEVVDHLYLLNRSKDTLTIVDTLRFFNCHSVDILNRPTILLNKTPKEIYLGDRSCLYLKDRANSFLELYRIEELKKGYLLSFWQANDNANIEIFVIKKKKLKLKVESKGIF